MSKKIINQNRNYNTELLDSIESQFIFEKKPVNRFSKTKISHVQNNLEEKLNKQQKLDELKSQINSIEDCSIKNNSKKIILGSGNINSQIMLIGETPGIKETESGETFLGEVGELLKKMLMSLE